MFEIKIALAQVGSLTGARDFGGLVSRLVDMIRFYIVPFIIALALMFFLWGVFKTVTAAGDSKKRQEGIGYITYGIIGLAVMISVWSLVAILTSTFFSNGLIVPQLR